MKNYENYELEDFACNDDFINWCLQTDESNNQFWSNWLQSHPTKRTIILQAKQLVLDLQSIDGAESGQDFEREIWSGIEVSILEDNEFSKIRFFQWKFLGAAVVLVLLSLGMLYQNYAGTDSTAKMADLEWTNFENNSGLSITFQLSDNSTVVLEPFSALKYPSIFADDQRVVFLKGEAFFDIARDTSKPFLVYANETITKVLGTSFTVIAFEGEKTVEVDVKSGKVVVYAKVASNDDKDREKRIVVQTDERISIPRPNKKIEVTPNQKVVFNKKGRRMIKMVTELPQVITKLEDLPQFNFRNESVIKVFRVIEQAYGIDLEFDEELLKTCTITTKLENEPLFQKMNIICTALNLEFREVDAVIFIEGEGC